MPYALSKGGWLGLVALFMISIICMYTVMLLRYCMYFNPLIQTYPDIGHLAFGNKGRIMMALLMHIELYFVAIGLLIIEGENISRIFPGVQVHIFGIIFEGKKVFILLSSLLVLPTTWPMNFRVLSYLSMASFLVFLFLLALILWIGEFQGVGFTEKGVTVNWSQMPTTLSIFIFSFGGHPIMPTIYSSMKDKKKFAKVLIIGFTICIVQYGLIAVIGYLMFGKETQSIVTLNLPQSLLTSKIAIWTVVAIPLVKYSLIIMPINISLEDQFQITGRPMSILIRTSMVISTVIIAAIVPYFAFFVGFTGSLISGMVTIIMPCLCYLKIFKSSLKGKVKTPVILCIIGIGALISILGTYVTIKNFIQANIINKIFLVTMGNAKKIILPAIRQTALRLFIYPSVDTIIKVHRPRMWRMLAGSPLQSYKVVVSYTNMVLREQIETWFSGLKCYVNYILKTATPFVTVLVRNPYLIHLLRKVSDRKSIALRSMKSDTNFFQALINAVNAVSGFGLLAMPYALSEGGWLGLVTLFIISIICMYTVMLLRYCMDFNPLIQTYPDIGQLAFANKGRIIMALLMHIELYFVAIGLLIIEGENISTIFPGVEVHIFGKIFEGKKVFILLSSLFILPTTWPSNFRVLSYLSMASFLVFLFLLALILWIGVFQGVGFNEKGVTVNWSQMPTTLSIFIFSFGGHAIMPTIYSSMKDKKKFSKVLIIGFTTCTVQYGLIAVIGYLMFGEETQSILTLNLPQSLLTSKIAIWIVVVIPLVKYSLIIMPINISLEDQFQITGRQMSILIRTLMVISTAIIAATMPFFAFFVGFTGSLISGMVTIIMPCLCYLKIFKSSLKGSVKTPMILCIIGFGALISILGTYVSIRNFIQDVLTKV
ncbi:hypothetical protein IEQ34_019612 [Dendrobium chrysotoxum]|uniref:Amino acid transporter transmembrane domain-containing protein n=1 Tax=Dendrobium chrysotoxum TaxID=161865 RepID=A0AAV7GAF8_DENCH|nr:hypothetical protein IEQ34_019612 [Dendrobium chrysotoxum]